MASERRRTVQNHAVRGRILPRVVGENTGVTFGNQKSRRITRFSMKFCDIRSGEVCKIRSSSHRAGNYYTFRNRAVFKRVVLTHSGGFARFRLKSDAGHIPRAARLLYFPRP